MEYVVKNHRIFESGNPVSFKKTPSQANGFAPEGIVLHDTAGRLDRFSSVNWFLDPKAHASAHFVIERDGTVTQMADLNRRCWHAGESFYGGRGNVNEFAFGIEIVNMGKLDRIGDSVFRTWFKKDYHQGQDGLTFHRKATSNHGEGFWHDYSSEQIEAVVGLCRALKMKYAIKWISTHWFISPGRKVDTNPLFPLDDVRASVFGMEESASLVLTTIAGVNQRRWPSFADNVIQSIPRGTLLNIIREGTFTNEGRTGVWYLVSYNDHEGWVHADYLA